MQTQLPKSDSRGTYSLDVDGIPNLVFIAEGQVGRSDIKWNDYAGKLMIKLQDRFIATCCLVHFTGNCGAKALAHLSITAPKAEDKRKLLQVFESFAYHKTNCGILVGSDTTKPYVGQTLTTLREVGENYHVLDSIPNPNWRHETALFWKDLTKSTHANYWNGGKEERLVG